MALSRQRKQRLRRQANVRAAREHVPATGEARSAIRQANRAYGREVADLHGAQRVQLSQLSGMLQNIGRSGLKGRYAAQTAADLRSRKADAISGLPYALSVARQDRNDQVADARSSLADARAAQAEAAGREYNRLLDQARKNKQSRVRERRENSGLDRGVRNALIVADVAFKNSEREDQAAFLKDPAAFAAGIAKKAEGADPVDARKAVAILFKRVRKDRLKGTFENLYGPQDWDKKKGRRRR